MKAILESFLMVVGTMATGIFLIWLFLHDHSKAIKDSVNPPSACTCQHQQP